MKFEILKNGKVIETLELSEGSHKMGRSKECDVVLSSPQVSKQHAMLVIKDGKAAIVDLGSSNGVFINGILVRKQRIRSKDDVRIADFQLRVPSSIKKSRPRVAGGTPPPMPEQEFGAVDGNLAVDLNAASVPAGDLDPGLDPQLNVEPEARNPETPQEKFVQLMDSKVFAPLYDVMQSVEWKFVLLGILGFSFISVLGAAIFSTVPWGQQLATDQAVARARVLLQQVVRENYRVLAKTNDFNRLTVDSAVDADGMLSVSIVDPKANTILAPAEFFNKSVSDVDYVSALKQAKKGKPGRVEILSGRFALTEPILLYSQEEAADKVVAIVLADFQTPEGINSVYEPSVRAILFGVLFLLGTFFVISKMVTHPIARLHDQVDAALKGDSVDIHSEVRMPELENLATSINFAMSKINTGSDAEVPLGSEDSETDKQSLLKVFKRLDGMTGDGFLVLDSEKKVVAVGDVAEELLSLREKYAAGQNISEACKDPGFAGACIDLVDRTIGALGERMSTELEVNGTLRELSAVGYSAADGSIPYVIISVKLNGAE